MPRKAKDEEEKIVNSKPKTKKTSSTSSTKKTTASKKSAPKTTTKKSASSKKSSDSKEVKTKKVATTKKASPKKATAEKKATSKNVVEKKSATKKADSKVKATKTVAKKTTSKAKKEAEKKPAKATKRAPVKKTTITRKRTTKKAKKIVAVPIEDTTLEYYDLPFRYNETIVKLLAQTPKKLFIYWDISDSDRQNLISNFGEDFFNNTKPVLIIHNENTNNSFEIEINDFANCWYLDVDDTSVKYKVELGRRSKKQDYFIPNDYIYLTSSNELENPNDHILFEKLSNTVYFRNVKSNVTYPKNIANMSFMQRMGKIYNIYDAYKKLYGKIYGEEDFLSNPSSGFMNF